GFSLSEPVTGAATDVTITQRTGAGDSTVPDQPAQFQLLVLGAPESVLALCQAVPAAVQVQLTQMLAQGLRVVCLAERSAAQLDAITAELQQLNFVALIGIQDAVRSDAAASVAAARQAGLTVAMITGDHPATALYVAQQVGIGTDVTALMTGAEFMQLTPAQQLAILPTKSIFARFTPQAKFALVQLYQQQHKIVAVTGDGVNDAPALAAANVGIVMGSTGTEVAKQTADLILLNDAFSGILYAIEQGRHIFYTLKRVVLYFFATNLGEVLVVAGALLWNLPVPILPAQILWLNLVTDGFLDIALSMEQLEPETLYQRWNQHSQQLFTVNMLYRIGYMALMMGLGSLLIFRWYQSVSLAYAQTMTLLTMALYQWFNAWNCRSDYRSVFSLGWFSNRWLVLAAGVVLALQFAVVYVPWLRWIFKTVPINGWDWLVVFGMAVTVFIAEELRKLVVMRWFRC
ncbi:MAG TPA: HAD-IC family P-type ATPase, partial [Candidatus Babeliales bacterium]|nr:HAD-IC family P-type ATPase [Candidatus Babeliales bacterium]